MNVYLPIVDEVEFYEMYRGSKDNNMCVPLLAAICRAASRLLDDNDEVIKKHNVSRASLFKLFTEQLKVKFAVDFFEPKLECVQIFLLNASNTEKWCAESTDWIEISMAAKMASRRAMVFRHTCDVDTMFQAQALGIHRSNTQWNVSARGLEARKKLWWSAYVLDRWISASLGRYVLISVSHSKLLRLKLNKRPIVISDADCDVELPSVEEDETAAFLICFVKLSTILGDVLRVLCSPRVRKFCDRRFGLDFVCKNLEETLRSWEERIPDNLKLTQEELESIRLNIIKPDLVQKLNRGGIVPQSIQESQQ